MNIELNLDCVYDEVKASIIATVWNNEKLGRKTKDEDIAKMTGYPEKIITQTIARMEADHSITRV